jgi:8-oxo-dGTP diphosphatase
LPGEGVCHVASLRGPVTIEIIYPERIVVPVDALPDAPDTVVVVDVANVMGSRADGWWRDRAGAALRLHEEIAALAARGVRPSQLPVGPPPLPVSPASATPASATPVEETQLRNRCRDSDTERAIEDAVGEVEDAVGDAIEDAVGEATGGVVYPWFVLVLEGRARDAVERVDAPCPRVRVVRAAGSGDDAIVAETASLAASGASCLVVTADRELRRRCVAAGASVVGPSWLLGLL